MNETEIAGAAARGAGAGAGEATRGGPVASGPAASEPAARGAGDTVLACAGLAKTFVEGRLKVTVLRGIDLSLTRGERVAVVGASGSGKSTLLHLLGGLDEPSSGTVRIGGRLLAGLSEAERGRLRNRDLGFVYQFHHLLPELTALENVALPLLIGGATRREANRRAVALLEAVGLAERQAHKPGELSGGERQRTAVARALVTEPTCLLADEPTGNLDRENAERVFSLLLDLNRQVGSTLLVVTHDHGLAARMDRTLTLRDGQICP
jgi:lipoprotein-releasing system ATP-binding protein